MIDYRTTGALYGTQAPDWSSPFVQRVGNETSEDRRIALVTWLAGEQQLTIDLLLTFYHQPQLTVQVLTMYLLS